MCPIFVFVCRMRANAETSAVAGGALKRKLSDSNRIAILAEKKIHRDAARFGLVSKRECWR